MVIANYKFYMVKVGLCPNVYSRIFIFIWILIVIHWGYVVEILHKKKEAIDIGKMIKKTLSRNPLLVKSRHLEQVIYLLHNANLVMDLNAWTKFEINSGWGNFSWIDYYFISILSVNVLL